MTQTKRPPANPVRFKTTGVLGGLSTSVDGLGDNIEALDGRLAKSEARQVEFERYVVSVLLQTNPPLGKTSDEVQKSWNVGEDVTKFTNTGMSTAKSLDAWANFVDGPR